MASRTEALKWQHFFVAAGIPETISARYARSFSEQRVNLTMLDDLDKSTLLELGVMAVGDQLAILRHIRQLKKSQEKVTDSDAATEESKKSGKSGGGRNKEMKAASSAPDRDDIYHIRLPAGTTPKTRAILQKHNMLKSAGLLKRGSSGIRQSGKNLIISSGIHTGKPVQNRSSGAASNKTCSINLSTPAEVSSTTDDFYDRMGVKGFVSDKLEVKDRIVRVPPSFASSPSIFARAINESAASCVAEPVLRVKIGEKARRVWKPRGQGISPTQLKFKGAVSRKKVRNAHLDLNNERIRNRFRMSVFDRLG